MARKKKAVGSTRRRPRRVGSAFTDFMTVAAGAIAGGVASRWAATSFGKGVNPQLIAIGEVGGGFYIGSQAKHLFVKGMGLGMAVEGATFFGQKMGVLKGVDDMDYISGDEYDYISGPGDPQNFANLSEISGDGDEDY